MKINKKPELERYMWRYDPIEGFPTIHVGKSTYLDYYASIKFWTDSGRSFPGFSLEIVPADPQYFVDKILLNTQVNNLAFIVFEF